MDKISRRSFLTTSGTLAAIYPMIGLIEGCTPNYEDIANLKTGLQISNENGMNLTLYFINLRFRGGKLVPENNGKSYLIAQLPPQSLHEQYFVSTVEQKSPEKQLKAKLSGHSFLAFELWPDYEENSSRKISYNAASLLNWKNSSTFKLLTTLDNKGNMQSYGVPADVSTALIPPGTRSIIDLSHYQNLIQRLLKKNNYLSILELPAGLLLAPHTRNDWARIEVIRNDYRIAAREYEFSIHNQLIRRRIIERGNLELRYISIPGNHSFAPIPPTLRAIGIISSEQFKPANPTNPCQCILPDTSIKENFLPTLLDKAELVYLNQQNKQDERYDITVKSPFLLTSTGATLKFSYKNHELKGEHPNLSLVEYEHHFQDGRDNFIKVSRIGVIAPSSQKALHVRIAQRKVIDGEAFLDYNEFIEILEPEKHFPTPGSQMNSAIPYHVPLKDGQKAADGTSTKIPIDQHNDDQIHFNTIRSRFTRTPPIRPIASDCATSFWVYQQYGQQRNEDILQLEFDYFDRNGRQVDKPVKHAIFFMRRDFFCNDAAINTLMAQTLPEFDDGVRLRMNFQDQVVAFAPDDPTVEEDQHSVPNKINQLKTSFSDYYFNIAKNLDPGGNIFDSVPYIIYPQISRAKVFIDNFQQYGQKPLPSVIKYNQDYLRHYFDREKNPARIIAQQADDFMTGKIRDFRGEANLPLENITRLNDAYSDIVQIFNKAADKAGGMVNPDLKHKYLSYFQGVTLYDNINQELAATLDKKPSEKLLKIVEIFKGDSAEIFNGVSLKMILEEISEAGLTPNFATDKIIAEIENIEAYIREITSNALITDALTYVRTVDKTIKDAKKELQEVNSAIAGYQRQLTDTKSELLALIPDINKIRNIAKMAFEQKRLEMFSIAGDAKTALKVAKDEFIRDAYNQKIDFVKIKDITSALSEKLLNVLTIVATSLPDTEGELKRKITLINTATFNALKTKCEGLAVLPLSVIRESQNDILIGLPFDFYYSTNPAKLGLQKLKQELIRLNSLYQNGHNEVKQELIKIQTALAAKKEEIDQSFDQQISTILTCADEILAKIESPEKHFYQQVFDAMRALQKLSIGYFINRFEQFSTNSQDNLSTTSQNLKVLAEKAFSIGQEIQQSRAALLDDYLTAITAVNQDIKTAGECWSKLQQMEQGLTNRIDQVILNAKKELSFYSARKKAELIEDISRELDKQIGNYKLFIENYQKALLAQGKDMMENIRKAFEEKIHAEVDLNKINSARIEFERVLNFLSTPKRQEFKYQWETGKFKTASLGIIKFNPQSNPSTRLKVDVRTNILIDPLKFPSVIDKVETYAENSLTNFSLTFLSALTIDFSHVQFSTGTGVSTKMNVGIRDVKFDGALSFIQKLEELMGGLGQGFGISIKPTSVAISYTSPVINIATPGFSFTNITFGVMLQLYFDRKPMELTFMLSRPEAKATIAAGIYGGGFFCALVAEPKRGLKSIEMALEMGAILAISIGPIKGEVRFMVGLYYKKDDQGVVMEGYFIAEGILSVWIISVSARLYMYVRSQNSQVTGGCTASYSAKLGFIKKTFRGSYKKTLAGAESSRSQPQQDSSLALYNIMKNQPLDESAHMFDLFFEDDDYQPLNREEWKKIHNTFYTN